MTNPAFARVKIDAVLAAQCWSTQVIWNNPSR